jgi:hypothetical protein
MFEIGTAEFGTAEINPLTLWDLHCVKELDDGGFIDDLIKQMKRSSAPGDFFLITVFQEGSRELPDFFQRIFSFSSTVRV